MQTFIDRKARLARLWSNQELRKFAPLFDGSVINVSAWQDSDKEGSTYRSYFANSTSYTVSNFKADARGWQGSDSELFLDLEQPLPPNLKQKFDVVFNHTTLEHVFDFHTAFQNLCTLSNDIVIVVVPLLQQMHGNYGDYWRFTPLALKRMYENQGLTILYSSFNNQNNAAVYLFFIGSKNPAKWRSKIHNQFSYHAPGHAFESPHTLAGSRAIKNPLPARIYFALKSLSRGNKPE